MDTDISQMTFRALPSQALLLDIHHTVILLQDATIIQHAALKIQTLPKGLISWFRTQTELLEGRVTDGGVDKRQILRSAELIIIGQSAGMNAVVIFNKETGIAMGKGTLVQNVSSN